MIIVDTNIILRYLLCDNKELYTKAVEIIDNNDIYIPTEVIVEVCYILQKVYNISGEEIYNDFIAELLNMENIHFQNSNTINLAFKTYSKNL